jgi:predicted O-methyltransferase YrrM
LELISLADPPVNSVHGLIDMMRQLPRLDLVIEVGSYSGVSAEVFLHFCNRLIAVDHWRGHDRAKREFDARFSAAPNVSYLRMASLEAAGLIADGVADLLYIDADHREEAGFADIAAWRPKVKPGGWLAGHDYTEAVSGGGVIRAVNRQFGRPHAVFSDSSWIVRL